MFQENEENPSKQAKSLVDNRCLKEETEDDHDSEESEGPMGVDEQAEKIKNDYEAALKGNCFRDIVFISTILFLVILSLYYFL